MKQVLIIGSDFAPSSLPPALRIRFFARHLPDFGWRPIVLTTKSKYYDWDLDSDSDILVPESLEVVRTSAIPSRVSRKFGIGDVGTRSMLHQWGAIKNLFKKQQIHMVFIPVPPYIPMVLGRLIHRRFKTPYVIDYIDPWVTDHYNKLPRSKRPPKWALADRVSRILEPIALKRVGHIVGVSKGTTDGVIVRYPSLSESDATEIPYGAEMADLEHVRRHPRQNKIFDKRDGLLHVSYVGRGGVDLQRSLTAFFQAVKLGLDRSPQLFDRLRLHFVGTCYSKNIENQFLVLPIAQKAGVGRWVTEHPNRVPYLDALQILLDSHGLAVFGSDEAHYTASKIFPYIMSQRHLLAIFHEESTVVDIVRGSCAGEVITFNETEPVNQKVESIYSGLERLLLLPKEYTAPTDWDNVHQYTTHAMAARLAAAFDKALEKYDTLEGSNSKLFARAPRPS